MKQLIKVLSGVCGIVMLFAAMGNAFVLHEWNVDLASPDALNRGYLDVNTPTGGSNLRYITEDNAQLEPNPDRAGGNWYVGPEFSPRNLNDAEALYADTDNTYLYLCVIQGMPFDDVNTGAGDIGLDIDRDGNFEFGLDMLGQNSANLMGDCSWISGKNWHNTVDTTDYFYRISGGTVVPSETLFAFSDNINSHYTIEARIPLAALGLVPSDGYNVHWGMGCSNDYLDLQVAPVPEASSMMLMGSGLLGFISIGTRRLMAKRK